MDWEPVQKPAEIAEKRLLEGILSGYFPVNTSLPGERELAEKIGVTRPTLREALQRLARDGWLDIQHGRSTRVRDYWREGNLGVLSVLAQTPTNKSLDFVVHLLEVRILLAPAYTRQALAAAPEEVINHLETYTSLDEDPTSFARADWRLHVLLTQLAGNPIFRLLLNSFQKLYIQMGEKYFSFPECRQHSSAFYAGLLDCARRAAEHEAESLTRRVMEESLKLWQRKQE